MVSGACLRTASVSRPCMTPARWVTGSSAIKSCKVLRERQASPVLPASLEDRPLPDGAHYLWDAVQHVLADVSLAVSDMRLPDPMRGIMSWQAAVFVAMRPPSNAQASCQGVTDVPDNPPAVTSSLQAVDFLHARNIVHRQLNPNNLMWFPAQQRWKLIDFSAWARSEEDVPLHYALRYAAPELLVADLHGVRAALMLATVEGRGEYRKAPSFVMCWPHGQVSPLSAVSLHCGAG